jgi:PAS domain S-box-containing protein
MSFLNQHSLRRKLVRVVMLSVSLALTLALASFATLEIRNYHAEARQELEVLSQVMGGCAAASIASGTPQEAERLVISLGTQKRVVEATIRDRSGAVLAHYLRPDTPSSDKESSLLLSRPLLRGGETLGTISLRADTRELRSRMLWLLAAGLLAATAIGCATWVVAARLGRMVTEPIAHLTETARRIAARQSIDRCVVRESKDEVGVLVDAFNAMLAQLWERQSQLEEFQRLAHLGNWALDPATRRFEWSEETFHIFGLDPTEAAPDYEDFRHQLRREDVRTLERALLRTRSHRSNLAQDFRILRSGGVPLWIHVTGTWFRDASGQEKLRGTVMDITDRKQAEAALLQGQKLESLGVLSGGIAHDFNNLLAALRSNLDLARASLDDSPQASAYLAKSEKIIERAANLTRQLLAYSGKGQFLVKPLDLTHQVKEMGNLLSVSVTKKAELRYEVKEGLPAILGDTSQIQQVVMNLVINASEALGEQGGSVRIRTGSEYLDEQHAGSAFTGHDLAPGPYVFLEVQDDGHGMEPRTLERIFDPFFSTKAQGRGLGLAAMQGIVKSHGGGIRVVSRVGQGTTFKVLFPSSNTFIEKPAPIEPSSQFNRSGRVLVVDDEPDIRFAAFDIFEHLGFEPILAADGVEAVARVKEHQGHLRLILLDMTMPRMNGVECLKAIRELDPEVPVLMTSGYSQNESTSELAGLHFNGFLEKPYSLSSLKAKMREILG